MLLEQSTLEHTNTNVTTEGSGGGKTALTRSWATGVTSTKANEQVSAELYTLVGLTVVARGIGCVCLHRTSSRIVSVHFVVWFWFGANDFFI